jgi:hypothetical protein
MIEIRRYLLLAVFFVVVINPVTSQENQSDTSKQKRVSIKYPNIIKINTLAVPFSNIALVYERGIISRVSAGIGVSYSVSGNAPPLFKKESTIIDARMNSIKGFSITPEARYYLRTCRPSFLDGFYGGVYLRYSNLSSDADFTYTPNENVMENYRADMTMNEFGVGIQLGYQIILWERFCIDLLFFGPRFSRHTLEYKFDPEPSDEFLNDLSEYLNDIANQFGLDYNLDLKPEGQNTANTSFSFVNMRFGISLGFAF